MPAEKFTKKADTGKRKRMWQHVYDSMRSSGEDEGSAIRAANAAVARDKAKSRKKT